MSIKVNVIKKHTLVFLLSLLIYKYFFDKFTFDITSQNYKCLSVSCPIPSPYQSPSYPSYEILDFFFIVNITRPTKIKVVKIAICFMLFFSFFTLNIMPFNLGKAQL